MEQKPSKSLQVVATIIGAILVIGIAFGLTIAIYKQNDDARRQSDERLAAFSQTVQNVGYAPIDLTDYVYYRNRWVRSVHVNIEGTCGVVIVVDDPSGPQVLLKGAGARDDNYSTWTPHPLSAASTLVCKLPTGS